jgi:hypothetical protein
MTDSTTTQPIAATNTGAKPITMQDIFTIMGQYVLEIEALRRQVANLRERLAEHGVPEG